METLPRLNTAVEFTDDNLPEEIEVNYKTGACFIGKVKDHKKTGSGKFVWPNGATYEGDFVDNLRHGKGSQCWPDGSKYCGQFVNDLRHGQGEITWANGEKYEGSFYKDRRHGNGVYSWPDGSLFTGMFHIDRKEGYGKFTFANGNIFEGLYKEDEREGPGVMTYTDGRQDVGLWQQEKLIKVCFPVEGAFTLQDHPEFDMNSDDVMYINMADDKNNRTSEIIEDLDNINPEKIAGFFNETLDPKSYAINKEEFDAEFFQDTKSEQTDEKIKAWNKTPSLIAIQKHVFKHAGRQKMAEFNVEKILAGDRTGFKDGGPLEKASNEYLLACISGDLTKVEDLLHSGRVHADVADVNGHTGLIGATVGWHIDIINLLLNHGADINKLNDEGCSALSAGVIFYYPIESFLYNIAERYLVKPPDEIVDDKRPQSKGSLKRKKQESFERRMSHVTNSMISSASERRSVSQRSDVEDLIDGQDTSRSSDGKDRLILPPITKVASRDSGVLNYDSMESFSTSDKIRPKSSDILDPNNFNQFTEKVPMKDEDRDSLFGSEEENEISFELEKQEEEFESYKSVHNYPIVITANLLEKCATTLSLNEKIVSRETKDSQGEGKARLLAIQISLRGTMKQTIDLLLRRGANPNTSGVPMPVIFFAIKAADTEMVKTLLSKGASTNSRLPKEKGGLAPLHIACAIPGEEGVEITEMLLQAFADPDVRAEEDDSFIQKDFEEEWSGDEISDASREILGGRTPLQIACARDDNYKHACKVVKLLLEHKANPNLLCNGFSPLALAITSGNDMAIDELLTYGADPSLPLTHGVGSALCVATSTEYEHRRPINSRIQLVDKLVKSGGNILAPILIGPKRLPGTAVDYAYYMFNQDRRIAHMPYHALTHAERETYNARRKLLAHIGDIMRVKATEREKRRMEEELREGLKSAGPSPGFVYTGAGAPLPPGSRGKGRAGQVKFDTATGTTTVDGAQPVVRKPLLKYCYECGRSVGVRLSACTRCKEVYYCSKACKIKAWNSRHKDECIRIGSKSRSPSPGRKGRSESPRAATLGEKAKSGQKKTPITVHELTKDKRALRILSSPSSQNLEHLEQHGLLSDQTQTGQGNQNQIRQQGGRQINQMQQAGRRANQMQQGGRQANQMQQGGRLANKMQPSGRLANQLARAGQVPVKGLSRSAGNTRSKFNKITSSDHRPRSDPLLHPWILDLPPNAIIDNYSYV